MELTITSKSQGIMTSQIFSELQQEQLAVQLSSTIKIGQTPIRCPGHNDFRIVTSHNLPNRLRFGTVFHGHVNFCLSFF